MNSKCLCGCCEKYLINAPSTSFGKKDVRICPVLYVSEDRHCTCPFCRLPPYAREPYFANKLLQLIHHQIEIGETELLRAKLIAETRKVTAKIAESKKVREAAEKEKEEKKKEKKMAPKKKSTNKNKKQK